MSITCSRCQAENNDVKYACWNCWAVLPRLITENSLLGETTVKGKTPATETLTDESFGNTAVIETPQPEKKKAGLFGSFGKKTTIEPEVQLGELTGLFAETPEKEVITTAAATAALDENEDLFAVTPDKNPVSLFPPEKEKKGLFGFGKKKTEPVQPEILTDMELPASATITPVPEIKTEPDVIPIIADDTKPKEEIINTPSSDAVTINPEISDIPATNEPAPKSQSAMQDETPFDFDFKAEVEKVFGGTDSSTHPVETPTNKPKRVRPQREDDGGLIRIKRPK